MFGRRRKERRTGRETLPGGALNVGSGRFPIPGWINIDLLDLPEVDRVVDVREGLPFCELAVISAEHFLEHLALPEAVAFLRECHRALADDGRLRLSTPNLEWVWLTHAPHGEDAPDTTRRTLVANRAFYAWGHRFLWTAPALAGALEATGFRNLSWHAYGESDDPRLRGIEQHETYPDASEQAHVLIVEADRGPFDAAALETWQRVAAEHFLEHL